MSITLVLDAMGVIFASADDVVELLQPFIAQRGGRSDSDHVNDLYTQASLDQLTPDDFWRGVGLDPSVEDEYLSMHRLTSGLKDFLGNVPDGISNVWCLSNDVGQWSSKLRRHFQLNDDLAGAVISGEVGLRKPDPAIYLSLLSRIGVPNDQIVFVDDRPKNLAPAHKLGIRTVHFGPSEQETAISDFNARSFDELDALLRSLN